METAFIASPVGTLELKSGNREEGLESCRLVEVELERWKEVVLLKKCSSTELNSVLKAAIDELRAYFHGTLKKFQTPLIYEDCSTEFQRMIWKAVEEIPYGSSLSYGELAVEAGYPGAHRAAGSACGRSDHFLFTPCHRVVSSNGLGSFPPGLDVKRFLLSLEGAE